jgi:hypothetical protein
MSKFALLIGINYEKSKLRLKGPDNDIESMSKILVKWGFDITTVLNEKATSYNLNTSLNKFCNKLKPGDKAVIYYTGHGLLFKNRLGKKEASLVPVDFKKCGVIPSETIRYYLNKISSGVNVLCIFDACSSGTICDLKFHIYDTSFKKDVTLKLKKYNPNEWNLRQINRHLKSNTGTGDIETLANIVVISGCWDDQVSYDLHKNGALTMSLLSIFDFYKVDKLSIQSFLQYLRGNLMFLRLNQTPQLTIGREIDLSVSMKEFLKIEK